MKTIKKFFAILLILAIGIAVINSQTDFFLNGNDKTGGFTY